jgi:hypothetical protein
MTTQPQPRPQPTELERRKIAFFAANKDLLDPRYVDLATAIWEAATKSTIDAVAALAIRHHIEAAVILRELRGDTL